MAYEDIDRTFTREDEWTSDCDITAAGDALVSVVHRRSGRVVARDVDAASGQASIEASFGSRLALRLFGIVMRAGRKRLPMLMRAHLERSVENTTRIHVVLRSDEGWLLFRLAELEWTYQKVFSRLLEELRAETRQANSGRPRDG